MSAPVPVVFLHGLWLHATAWDPWLELFAKEGYAPIAPGRPGESPTVIATRERPVGRGDHGIDDVVTHVARIIRGLDSTPVLVGHSFGGMIAQRLLRLNLARAVVAIDAAQIRGVLPVPLSALRAALPGNPANEHRPTTSLSAEQFRFAFGAAISAIEAQALFERWAIPAPTPLLFEFAAANFDRPTADAVDPADRPRAPLLLMVGGRNHTLPETVVRAALQRYRHEDAVTDIVEFADRGHSLTVDRRWREVADTALEL